MVTGGPGMGKSAILSAWLARREAAGEVVPHHFIRRQVADWDQPETIAASLAAQLEAAYPALRDPEAKPERRLLELLGRVSKQLGEAERMVIVVDGLDETRAEPGDNPLPRFLPHVVPAGIRFLCATRPTSPHLSWIEARGLIRRLDLDEGRWAASNAAVVRTFWEAAASEYRPRLPAEAIASAIAHADGNVLHAVMLHDAWRDLPAAERRADRIPRGLQALIGEIWDRAASHERVRLGLGLLCAAREALSLEVLEELAGWSYDDKARFAHEARQLLLEEPAAWAGSPAYRPRHDWVRELIAARLGAPAMRAHHEILSRTLATWPPSMQATARRYALRHSLIHRAEAGDWTGAWRLAADLGFLEAKCRELDAHEAEADVARLAERCRATGDRALSLYFDELARALGRESHRLRAVPEATAALVWNRLRRSGWSVDKLETQLRIPAEATFLRVRYGATGESPALVRELVGHAGPVRACVVTADGRRVISASDDRTLKIWDLESGRALATLEGHDREVTACAVTADGRRAVSASNDRTLKVWDLETGRALATLEGHGRGVSACAVTADGRRVVSASKDRTLKVWDLETGRALATLEGHNREVSACAVTGDGRRAVSASWDRTLKVWDLETGRALATLEGHTGLVLACAVTADSRRVVSASWDKTLKVWDLETGRALATLEGHAGWVLACATTMDGERVISASHDGTLKIWDLDTGRMLATLAGHVSWVCACAVTADGCRGVSASYDWMLKVWDLTSERTRSTREGQASRVSSFAVTADGHRVVSSSYDGTLKIWEPESGHVLATLEGHAGPVRGCALTADGRCVVSASADRRLKIWDLETGRMLATIVGHVGGVMGCAVTADGRRVISASWDKTLKIWDFESGRMLATLTGHGGEVNACVVTPDGRRVVSASADKTLKVWDLETGRALYTLEDHAGEVTACALTIDGRRVISASVDRTLKIWDLESGRALATLVGHVDGVMGCAVTADGRRVISASGDKTVKVWDLDTHACLFTHWGDSAYTAIAATASNIVAGDLAGTVWFLEWPREFSPGQPRSRRAKTRGTQPPSTHQRRRR